MISSGLSPFIIMLGGSERLLTLSWIVGTHTLPTFLLAADKEIKGEG